MTVSGREFTSFMGALASLITQYSFASTEYLTTQTYYFCGVAAVLHGYNPLTATISHYELFRSANQSTDNRFLFSSPVEGKRLSAIDAFQQVKECAANDKRDVLLYAKFEALFAGLINPINGA